MRTVGELIEATRLQGVRLEITGSDRLRYVGPTMSAFYVKALLANRDAIRDILELEARLQIGWTRCSTQKDPALRDHYESHWIRLLHEYETVCSRERLPGESEEAA